MSTKKTELKVTINCEKCKTKVLKAVTKLTGVDSEKGTLTIVGTVDSVCVITAIRNTRKFAEITSVGPPKPCPPLPACCKQCQLVGVSYVTYDSAPCSIL